MENDNLKKYGGIGVLLLANLLAWGGSGMITLIVLYVVGFVLIGSSTMNRSSKMKWISLSLLLIGIFYIYNLLF